MTAERRTPATRSSLLRCVRRLTQVNRGAALLRRKRQSLVDELFRRARTAVASREGIDAQAQRAWHALWLALASEGSDGLAPLGWPTREVQVDLTVLELWGIKAAALAHPPALVRSVAARGVAPAAGETAGADAARQLERLIEQVIAAAPEEHAMRRLGQALARTTRLVNTLEQRIAVWLSADLAGIRRTLGERERDEHLRVKRLMAGRRSSPSAP